jgi:hypothetical protein
MLAFADIPTGATTNKGFDVNDLEGRSVAPAIALTRSEPTSKSAGLPLKKRLRLSHTGGPARPTEMIGGSRNLGES